MRQFEVGTTYMTRVVGEWPCTFLFPVVARTRRSVTFQKSNGDLVKRRIFDNGEYEFAFPLGRHARFPVITA